MRTYRCYVQAALAPGKPITLSERASEHLGRVLRFQIGDSVTLFNGDGNDYQAKLTSVAKRGMVAEVRSVHSAHTESPLRITLAQSIARGEKMDSVIQKATELGAAAIIPLLTERTEVRLDSEREEKRLQHWQGVIIAACEQSGRACLPVLQAPLTLTEFAAASPDNVLRIALDPTGAHSLSDIHPADGNEIQAVIGPEGGLSPRDLDALDHAGFLRLRFGPRVLRTETAGPALLAALQSRFGDMGGLNENPVASDF